MNRSFNGLVLALEKKNAETGQRYAIEDSFDSPEIGQERFKSGIVEYPVRQLTASERSAFLSEKAVGQRPTTLPKIRATLRNIIEKNSPTKIIPVTVWLENLDTVSLTTEIELSIGRGEISSEEEFVEKRQNILKDRAVQIEAVQNKLIKKLGPQVQVGFRYRNIPMLELKLALGDIEQLALASEVLSIETMTQSVDGLVAGSEVVDGSQITQFVNSGHDGWSAKWAVIELGAANYNHYVFRNTNSIFWPQSRILGKYSCSGSGSSASCSSSTWSSYGGHATLVTGIVGGDLRDGQDSSVPVAGRIDRSGYAGESYGYVYRANYGTTRYDRVMAAYDHIVSQDKVAIFNQSNGVPYNSSAGDPSCSGRTNFARAINTVFESGILPVMHAGNEGAVISGCTLRDPASALGSFTVAGHGSSANSNNEASVRNGPIWSLSSQGPITGRSMVDMTAYACRTLLPNTANSYSTTTPCGTSISAPTVVSGAVDFIDFYKSTFSNFIDNPAVLATNLLLMGDRQGESGYKTYGYDRRWGAGRFKMRMFNSLGLDNPAAWKTGSVCVDGGETVEISINGGNPLPYDVDYLKAVIFYYDSRHDLVSSNALDDIDLRLRKTNGTLLRSSISSFDNKERVFYTDPGGMAVKLEVSGWNVTADNAGCGSNSMRVYYAVIWEDNDRDDSTGMTGLDPEF